MYEQITSVLQINQISALSPVLGRVAVPQTEVKALLTDGGAGTGWDLYNSDSELLPASQ